MKDLQDIIALARHAGAERAALATLVSVDGSSYRRPGASMLLTPDGRRAGGISGGCLERDVERHCREVLAAGKPRLVLYDTQSEADLIIGTGLGCGGRLEILVEPIALSAEFGPIARWAGALERREALAEVIIVADAVPTNGTLTNDASTSDASTSGASASDESASDGPAHEAFTSDAPAVAAVTDASTADSAASSTAPAVDSIGSEAPASSSSMRGHQAGESHDRAHGGGHGPHARATAGWRLFLWSHALGDPAWHHAHPAERHAASARSHATHAPVDPMIQVVEAATDAARAALERGTPSAPVRLDTADGPVAAFVRLIAPPVQLLLCGAGDDAVPLVRMATTLGWYVRVIDHRAAFATRDRFPEAAIVDVAAAGELPGSVRLDARTVAVTMNHNFRADSAWLRTLAALPLPYVGVLGARTRTERLLRDAELDTLGVPGSPALRHVFAPAGLDLGSEGADQIALSIVAEIQAVLAGRHGTSMRDRPVAARAGSALKA